MVVNQTIVAYALLILDKKFTLDLVPAVNQGGVVNTQPIVESDDKEATIDLVKGTKGAV